MFNVCPLKWIPIPSLGSFSLTMNFFSLTLTFLDGDFLLGVTVALGGLIMLRHAGALITVSKMKPKVLRKKWDLCIFFPLR